MSRVVSALAVIALVVAACGNGEPTTTLSDETGTTPQGSNNITVVGEDIAFDKTSLTASAGEEITVTFDNRDSGVAHNFRVEAPSGPIATEVEAGPVEQTISFTIDQPGTYEFLCEVHPAQMVGELVIEGG